MTVFDIAPPEGFQPEIGLLAATLVDGTREWRDEIGTPSNEALRWQPFPNGHSIGGLLMHIAHVEEWWIEEVAAGRILTEEQKREFLSEETKVYEVVWPTPPDWTYDQYIERLDRVRQRTLATLRELTDPTEIRPLDETFSTTLRWIVGHIVQHESYHAGQAVLLHLMHHRMKA